MYDGWKGLADPVCEQVLGYRVTDMYTKAMYLEDCRQFPLAKRLVGQPSEFVGPLFHETDMPANVRLIGPFVLQEGEQLKVANGASGSEFGTTDDLAISLRPGANRLTWVGAA